jgi:hypothetical protein
VFTSLRKVLNMAVMIAISPDLQFTNWHRISFLILISGLAANGVEQLGGVGKSPEKTVIDPFNFLEEADDPFAGAADAAEEFNDSAD